jgi:hypothetical protein
LLRKPRKMIECAVFLKKLWSDVLSFEEKDRYLHSETVVQRNCKTQTKAAIRSSDRRELTTATAGADDSNRVTINRNSNIEDSKL